jgi:hypothetical protein
MKEIGWKIRCKIKVNFIIKMDNWLILESGKMIVFMEKE